MTEVEQPAPARIKEEDPDLPKLENIKDRSPDRSSRKRRRDSSEDRDERKSRRRYDRSSSRSRSRNRSRERRRDRRSRSRSRHRSRSRSKDRKRHRRSRSRSNERRNRSNGKSPDRKKKKDEVPMEEQVQKLAELGNGAKTGGVYIPPFKLAMMQKEIQDKSSKEYQKLTWDALRKSLNGLINKVSVANIKNILPEVFQENLVRGRGLFCRSIMKAQAASPTFTNVYAALVAIINTKMPEVGELLVKRLVDQFLKSFRRHNRAALLPTVKFIAHLTNQQVVDPLLPLQILLTLLSKPSDDSVEVATVFIKECGLKLEELAPQGFKKIFEQFRSILHEGSIDRRTQYMIEDLFAVRKTHFQDFPAVIEALDLVEEDDAIVHTVALDDPVDPEEHLNYFQEDPNYLENEEKYDQVRKEILGDSDEESSDGSGSGSSDESDEEDGEEKKTDENKMVITDNTDLETVNLKRHIYLTIMSSLDFEECAHKLKKMNLQPGQEPHLAQMIIECCAQERTFLRFYALLAQRFCQLETTYMDLFQKLFVDQYENIHRLETNKLRNVAKMFAHLLHTDAMSWSVLEAVHLNEQETTSSSRIFIKILFQELAEYMGLVKLNARLQDPYLRQHFTNIMPKDNPKNTRFAINFFTSIGLGGLTDDLREFLKNAPKQVIQAPVESSSSSSDSSSDSSDSSSDSDSDSDSSSDSSDSSSSSSSSSSSDNRDRKRRRTK